MRKAFVDTFMKLCLKDPSVFLLTADLGFMAFEPVRDAFPDNFLNVGVAEANMVGVAAGLAKCGRKVFLYSMIPFATMRCLEQIRICLAMPKEHIIIVGIGGGYSYGSQGPSHHAIEDIGVMSALPNMRILSPSDPWEAGHCFEQAFKEQGHTYVRLGKNGEPLLHKFDDHFRPDTWSVLRKGKDVAIIATGSIANSSLEAAALLSKDGISARVISAHILKPLNPAMVRSVLKGCSYIFTVEQHSPWGGLGAIVSQIIIKADIPYKKFHAFSTFDGFHNIAGDQEYLERKDGLDAKTIARKILLLHASKPGGKRC